MVTSIHFFTVGFEGRLHFAVYCSIIASLIYKSPPLAET
jgi:hypothetical protein